MKLPRILKIIIMVSVTVLLFLGAIFGLLIVSFGVRLPYLNLFFRQVVWIVPLGLWLVILMLLFTRIPKKFIGMGSAVIVVALVLTGVGIHQYESRLEDLRLDERGFDLYDYQPFIDSNLLAGLDEEASFSMEEPLLTLDGATALYPVYAAFVEAVYPRGWYPPFGGGSPVVSMQTDRAYERLIQGRTDIIFVAQPSEEQEAMAEARGVELHLTPIGKEAFVFFVNMENPVSDLTVDEIIGIYSGEITNWSDVGGPDRAIEAFQRPSGSGSQTALESIMAGHDLMDPPRELTIGSMGGIIRQAASYQNHPASIGFSFRYYSTELVGDESIKHLSIDGVYPGEENIRNDTYPFTSNFYAVTTTDDDETINSFIEWILSPEGQLLVERSGYTPINE